MISRSPSKATAPSLVRWPSSRGYLLRHASPSTRRFARATLLTAVWTFVAVGLGGIVGLATFILPPTGVFGIVAAPFLLLLWVLPDLPAVPLAMARRFLFLMLFVDICVPNYYMIQVPGLPWLSVRRIVTFVEILTLALSISGAPEVRAKLSKSLQSFPMISYSATGFLLAIVLSLTTAIAFAISLSAAVDAFLTWYIPFFAVLILADDEATIGKVMRLIGWASLIVAAAGILEFVLERRYYFDIFPKSMLSAMMAANPSIEAIVNANPYRNGFYRASSIFSVPLSFGEFESMVAPIGAYFAFHATNRRDRLLGLAVLLSAPIAIFCSGARGAYISLLLAAALFAILWVTRQARFEERSLAPGITTVAAVIGFSLTIALIVFWPRLHNVVLGGGDAAASTDARFIQWDLAKPKIAASPLTGYGIGMGAEVVGYYTASPIPSVDSYVITLLVEIGVPGFLLFCLMIGAGMASGAKSYCVRNTQLGALCGALACSLLAYAFYRTALSAHENNMITFCILALLVVARGRFLSAETPARPSPP